MKINKTFITKNLYRSFLTALPCCIATVLFSFTGFFENFDFKTLNVAFQLRSPILVDSRIVTIDIDDTALNSVGRWPWPWNIHAEVVHFLKLYQVISATFVDIDFSTEQPISLSPNAVAMFSSEIANGNIPTISQSKEMFSEAISSGLPVFLTYEFKMSGSFLPSLNALDFKHVITNELKSFSLLQPPNLSLPLPILRQNSAGYGFNVILSDSDGIVRRYPTAIGIKDFGLPSLGVLTAMHILNANKISLSDSKKLMFDDNVSIPVNNKAEMLINWVGKYSDSYVHIPFNMLASFIAFDKAKMIAQRHPIDKLSDPSQLQGLISQELQALGIVNNKQIEYFSTVVFIASVIEFYYLNTSHSMDEIIAAIGLDPTDSFWKNIGYQIMLHNKAVSIFKTSKQLPHLDKLLTEILPNVDNETKNKLSDTYDQLSFFVNSNQIDRARPLIFHNRLELSQGAKKFFITPTFFKDKIVFYGLAATGLIAQQPSPFEERHSMQDLVPNVVNTILTQQFLSYAPYDFKLILSVLLGFITAFIVYTFTPLIGVSIMLVIWIIFAYSFWWTFTTHGLIIQMAMPATASASAFFTSSILRYLDEQRERKKVRNMFSTMVSPEVLKMLESNPQGITLNGQKLEATLFSSDVSGFTTISEGVTARELANILNLYLTPMSNIIMSYDGYIDKYEGDAIKADFGAPLSDPNHAWKACFAALYQQEMLKIIQRMIFLKYGVKITARMGINTGIVSAGNMGSVRRMQYTALGEAVIIAEELEPANKLFETWIAIGQRTAELAVDAVHVRYLNNMKLGHTHRSEMVFELQAWNLDTFLAYWKGKPVPDLIVREFKTMLPEKALAWLEYLRTKPLPDSEIRQFFMQTFNDTQDLAIEYMKLQNILSVNYIKSEIANLASNLNTNEVDYADVKALLLQAENEQRDYYQQLLKWRAAIRFALNDFKAQNLTTDADKFSNVIDIIDKNIECLNKRIHFAQEDDYVPHTMAEHLKELIVTDSALLSEAQINEINQKAQNLLLKIQSKINTIAERITQNPDEFHVFISQFCSINELQLKVNELYSEGVQFYKNRMWQEAIDKFDEALKILPTDGPSQKMKAYILKIKDSVLPEDWDSDWEA